MYCPPDTQCLLSGASTVYYELFVGIVLILAVALQAKTEGITSFVKRAVGQRSWIAEHAHGRSTDTTQAGSAQ